MQHGRHAGRSFNRSRNAWLTIVFLAASMLGTHSVLNAGSAATAVAVYNFDIPAQPLSSALRQFAQQSRREILFTPGLVAGKRSPGVAGNLPSLEALEALLTDTGLTWSTTPAGAILLHDLVKPTDRSEEHTSELQSLMRISYAVFCLKK